MSEEMKLRQIFDFAELEKLFKHFSVTTGFDVALYDVRGIEQLAVRGKASVCSSVIDRTECARNIVYGGSKAEQLGEPYIFCCGCGLVLSSVPVVFAGQLVGSIVGGPVMLWEKDELADLEISEKISPMGGVRFDMSEITQTSCAKLTSAVSILLVLVNYICNQASTYLEQKIEISRQQERILKLSLERQQALESVKRMEKHYSFVKYPADLEKELIAFVQRGDKPKAREILNHFLGEIFSYASGDLNVIRAKLYEFIAFLTRATVESGVPLQEMLVPIRKSTKLLDENIEFQDLCMIVVEILNLIIDCVYENRGKKTASPHLTNAINYINANFAEDLTLVDVASHAFINSYYLSHLFRDEMKITFSEYLVKVRIDRAKALFRERDMTIEEISEEVGFHDPSHFSRLFKKYVGVTPAKYKKIWY